METIVEKIKKVEKSGETVQKVHSNPNHPGEVVGGYSCLEV